MKIKAYLAGSGIDKNGNTMSSEALALITQQLNAGGVPVMPAPGGADMIGFVTAASLRDGAVHVEAEVDPAVVEGCLGAAFLAPAFQVEKVTVGPGDLQVIDECSVKATFLCNEHADQEATPIAREDKQRGE